MKEEQKVSFIHSISAKIMLLTVLAVVMSVLIVAFRAEAGAKKVVGDVSADYILSMAEMGVEIASIFHRRRMRTVECLSGYR